MRRDRLTAKIFLKMWKISELVFIRPQTDASSIAVSVEVIHKASSHCSLIHGATWVAHSYAAVDFLKTTD